MPERRWPRGVTPLLRSGASSRECQAVMAQKLPRGAPPTSEVRGGGQEELPHAQGQGLQLVGPTPRQRPGAVAERSNPTPKEQWLRGHRRA